MKKEYKNINIEIFLELVRSGLWGTEVRLTSNGEIDWLTLSQLAEKQSVVGLVTAGLGQVKDVKVPKEWSLRFIGNTLQIELRNKEMNGFVANLVADMRKTGISTLLVKGQGLAQCYEKPLWRACGDVDLYLSKDNYQQAKEFLIPKASHVDGEDNKQMHQGMTIDGWVVELHGTMHGEISRRMNKGLDEVHHAIFYDGSVRSWNNNGVQVFLPSADNDAIIVFTHFLQHFFVEGVGLRQICDWCRLLWKYRDVIDVRLLEKRLDMMGLTSEWKVFGTLAVKMLGMPPEAMPLLGDNDSHNLSKKAKRVLKRVMKSGNFGHNNDLSYRSKYKGLTYKIVAAWRRFWDFASLVPVFPLDAPSFFITYMRGKI